MKAIRDNVTENALTSGSIEVSDYEKALFVEGKGWVCMDGAEVVGFSCGRLNSGDVWALFVDSRYEGRGIGGQLMEFVETWMFSNGCREITLSTEVGTRAEHLYRRRGWEPVGMSGEKEIRFRLRR
jgi:GNAT superfamily N-acetyltransferase